MAGKTESLFSLELVAEKLYLPYISCRFPAIAFRLLDFPTILISHVEPDLANTIKRKIKRDPYYEVPSQFPELQDKHGNYMVKKGKSCLFKISPETLTMHLTNTPLYLMVIDEYPEVPKLLGNSSIPLNNCMDDIFKDIKKNGPTVPSVHGDKGLFKIYSLMGTEIGYVVLGFRLLSLGPGLIAHLPATAIARRASETCKEKKVTAKEVQEELVKENKLRRLEKEPKKVKNSASMTEVETRDALMQTMEINEERVHVELSAPEKKKEMQTIQTQTERMRLKQPPIKVLQKLDTDEQSDESEEDILIAPNTVRPPPLFYNSKAEPKVEIEKARIYEDYDSTFYDLTLDDLSGDEHITTPQKQEKKQKEEGKRPANEPHIQDARTIVISHVKGAKPPQPTVHAQNPAEPVFPLLTALLTELSKIQNPQLINQPMAQVQSNSIQIQPSGQPPAASVPSKPSVDVASEQTPQAENIKNEDGDTNISVKRKGRKAHRACAHPHGHVPKQKGWIRQAPEVGVKKTKLIFGLTNTQRLRLAKQNPTWLKSAEQDEKIVKAQRQKQRAKEQDQDLEAGNLSDTFTEVRRLAAAELATTAASTMKLESTLPEPAKSGITKKTKKKPPKSRDSSPEKDKGMRKRSKSPKTKANQPQKKEVIDIRSEEPLITEDTVSPSLPGDRLDSAADSMPSSKIEVRIPSAHQYDSEETYSSDHSDDFEVSPVSSRKDVHSKFPGFNNPDETLPESINGNMNKSANASLDEDSPLESTRVSKQFRAGTKDSTLFRSTEDYDTKQFQSTDEPELQKLISEEEKSDSFEVTPTLEPSGYSPTMSKAGEEKTTTNRLSMKFEVLNPTASMNSPIPALRRSTMKLDSINARPSPTGTPRSRSSGQGSGQDSPKQPTPRPRKPLRERRMEFKKESIHTESVSSYLPSESENILSLISDGSYSDDFHMSSEKDASSRLSTPELPKISMIPATKLGYTVH